MVKASSTAAGRIMATAAGRIMASAAGRIMASAARTLARTATHCLNTLLQRPHWGIKARDSRILDPGRKPGPRIPR